MFRLVHFLLFSGILLQSTTSKPQNLLKRYEHLLTPVNKYSVFKTNSAITIDGFDNELSWKNAKWSEEFVTLKGEVIPDTFYQTRFKMLWDNKYLYILAEIKDPHIWTYSANEDGIYYPGNLFAVLVNPDRTTHNFFEFDVNAQNNFNDQFFPMSPLHGGRERKDWQLRGYKSKVVIYGTLNNPEDIDEKWVVEMAVPFKSLSWDGRFPPPKNNELWKMNFLRIQWPTNIKFGKYLKMKENPDLKITNGIEYYRFAKNWTWSPTGIDNILYPGRWGLVKFSYQQVSSEIPEFELPEEEIYGKYLWFVYYKQQDYSKQNGYYAKALSELGIPQLITMDNNEKIFLKMETRGSSFYVKLQNKNGLSISVDQNGYFQILETTNQ